LVNVEVNCPVTSKEKSVARWPAGRPGARGVLGRAGEEVVDLDLGHPRPAGALPNSPVLMFARLHVAQQTGLGAHQPPSTS
jgi:hypothetical protein